MNIECGKYKVIKDIYIYVCDLGSLKVPKGKIIEMKEYKSAYVDGERIPYGFFRGLQIPSSESTLE